MEEESSRMWPEPWAPAKSTPASPPPTPHRTMAASLLKFHVIGYQAWIFVLAQCPGSGACCRRDTLCKLKLEKLLFSLASERGKKMSPLFPAPNQRRPVQLRWPISFMEKRGE